MTDHARAIEAGARAIWEARKSGDLSAWTTKNAAKACIEAAIASGALVPASAGQRAPLDWGKLVQCILRCMDATIKNESSREQAERIATAIEERFDTAPASGDYVVVPRSDLQVVVEIAGRSESAIEIECIKEWLKDAASRTGGGK